MINASSSFSMKKLKPIDENIKDNPFVQSGHIEPLQRIINGTSENQELYPHWYTSVEIPKIVDRQQEEISLL